MPWPSRRGAAAKATTLDRRVITFGRAAQLAEQQGNFQKGLSILDKLTSEERKFLGDPARMAARIVPVD